MGAGTRVPRVQEEIQKAIGSKEIGRFLNTDESIAMGALYQAAHLSKGFKVKPFDVEELVIFPVQVNFVSKQKQESGDIIEKPVTRHVFQFKGKYPTTKKTITFTSYTDDFSFDLNYSGLKHFNEDQIRQFDSLVSHLTTVSVAGLGKALEDKLKPEETEFSGVKVGFQMDLSGILRIEKAEAVLKRKSQGVLSRTRSLGSSRKKPEEGEPTEAEDKKDDEGVESTTPEEKPEETVEKPPAAEEKPVEETEKKETEEQSKEGKEQSKDGKEEQTEEKKTDESADSAENKTETDEKAKADAAAESEKKNATADAAAEEKKKVPQVVRVALKTMEKYTTAHMMSKDDVASAKKLLEEFEKRERHARDRAAAENELEAYAFEVSQLVEEADYVKHSTEEERSKLLEESKRIRTWLEDDVTPDTDTANFTRNHALLVSMVRPIKRRIDEGNTLPKAIANLESMLNSSRVMAGMGGDDEKALFNKSDADAFSKRLERWTTWLEEKKAEQEKKQPYEEPAVMTSEVHAKIKSLERELNSFMRKMRQTRIKDVEDLKKNDTNKTETSDKQGAEGAGTAEKEAAKREEGKADSQTTDQPVNETEGAPPAEKEGAEEAREAKSEAETTEKPDKDAEGKDDKVEL
ncbi:hypothetical protein COOONC_27992 [Cooperia oncophora]